jgi:hypothetical protein
MNKKCYNVKFRALTLVFKFILLFPNMWHCERLSPLGTAAITGLLYQPQMTYDGDCGAIWWNEDWLGKPKYSEKTCTSPTLFTTNPIWSDPGSNTDHHGGKSATNCLSYGTAPMLPVCEHSLVMSEVNESNKRAITHLQNESARSKTHVKFILDWYTLEWNPV